jgi:glutamine amidotransferase/cyclase
MNVYLLDYGAGNVRSLVNAVEFLGFTVIKIQKASDFDCAQAILFPGVGAFGTAIDALKDMGFLDPLKAYLKSNKPFMGICVGMQVLFLGSDESPDAQGIGLIPARVKRFSIKSTVPHMGWNFANCPQPVEGANISSTARYYFVHSFRVCEAGLDGWTYSRTTYGSETFVSSVLKGSVFATQFHPEKSGPAGLEVLRSFLLNYSSLSPKFINSPSIVRPEDGLSKRIIACLDVRTNDEGDLVVTKGDQYDVREKEGRNVRNLGIFLNIFIKREAC